MQVRQVEVVVISDLHLGTYGSHAAEAKAYLDSIECNTLILNGDIIDIWQFKKKYFPTSHQQLLFTLFKKIKNGTQVYYLTGNHDDALRKYTPLKMKGFAIVDKLVMEVDDKSYWIFHGDIFDASINQTKWLAKIGGKGYDILIRINRFINSLLKLWGKPPVSLSKKIKDNFKKAVQFVDNFEQSAIDLAIEQGYDYVICGHIHKPTIKPIKTEKGKTIYMNSGDWVESLTALEYQDKEWRIYSHHEKNITNLRIPSPQNKVNNPAFSLNSLL